MNKIIEFPRRVRVHEAGEDEYLTVDQFAAELHVNPETIRRGMRKSPPTFPGVKVGVEYRFNRADIRRWRRAQTEAA